MTALLHYGLALGNIAAEAVQNSLGIEIAVVHTGGMGHIGTGDHQTLLTDVGVGNISGGRGAVADEVTETSLGQNIVLAAGVGAGGADVTVLCVDDGIQGAAKAGPLAGFEVVGFHLPVSDIGLNLGSALLAVVNVAVGVAGDFITLISQGIDDLLSTFNLLVVVILTLRVLCTMHDPVAEDTVLTGHGQGGSCALIAEVGMCFDELFQNGNQVVVASDGFTGCGDHLSLDLAGQIVHNELGSEAGAVLIGNTVIVVSAGGYECPVEHLGLH